MGLKTIAIEHDQYGFWIDFLAIRFDFIAFWGWMEATFAIQNFESYTPCGLGLPSGELT